MGTTDDHTFDHVRGRFEEWRAAEGQRSAMRESTAETRAFLQTILADSGLYAKAAATYADELAVLFPAGGPQTRALARLAMEAFIAGWDAGHADGYEGAMADYASGEPPAA